jgi:hypothetical protein
MYLSKDDVNNYLNQVIREISRILRINGSDIDSIDELKSAIKVVYPTIHDLLEDFINSYWHWYDLVDENCKKPIDSIRMMNGIKGRDDSRDALCSKVKKEEQRINSEEEAINKLDELNERQKREFEEKIDCLKEIHQDTIQKRNSGKSFIK